MTPDQAQILALQALSWIIGDGQLSDVFLGASGASVEDLKAQAQEPEFQASVLDFLLLDDQWVTGFCDANGLSYEAPLQARSVLPGQELPHWT